MPGNPKDSKWRATPRERRNRKPLSVTLSEEARERLEMLAARFAFTLSTAVEALVQSDEAKAILAGAERERSAALVKRGAPEPDLDPATMAALRTFVQERVKKGPAKKGSKRT